MAGERYGLVEVTPPAAEPLTLAEAKAHVRVEAAFTADDDYLAALVKAARVQAEGLTARCLITTALRLSLDAFPAQGGEIELPRAPAIAVSAVSYVDPDGVTQALDPADYQITEGQEPARLAPSFDAVVWPACRTQYGAVKVAFTAGYGPAGPSVPEGLREAIRLLVGHWYERREVVVVGRFGPMPLSVEWLLQSYWYGR